MSEYRDRVLKTIQEHEKEYNPVDQYEIIDALGWLYEEIRGIPENDGLINGKPSHTRGMIIETLEKHLDIAEKVGSTEVHCVETDLVRCTIVLLGNPRNM